MKRTLLLFVMTMATLVGMSQQPVSSWELSLDAPALETQYKLCSPLELSDGSLLVSMMDVVGKNNAKIVKISAEGEIMDETSIEYGSEYYVNDIAMDISEGEVNIFSQLVSEDYSSVKIVHNFVYEDMGISEAREIYMTECDSLALTPIGLGSGRKPLLSPDGSRAFMYAYVSEKDAKDSSKDYYYYHNFISLIKFDSELNVMTENWMWNEEYHFSLFSTAPSLTFNEDGTGYYVICQGYLLPPSGRPNNLQYVFDGELNYQGYYNVYNCMPEFPIGYLQSFNASWRQNPYDGRIYGFGSVVYPYFEGHLFTCKLELESLFADMTYCTVNSPAGVQSEIIIGGNNIEFSPEGIMYGLGVYDINEMNYYYGFMENTVVSYIAVVHKGIERIEEWYYQKGENYNHYFDNIYYTQGGNVIISGELWSEVDGTVYYEPYIVKFDAKMFNPDNIEEAHAHGLKAAIAYPNPGGEVMNVRTSLRDCSLSVYDMQGRIIYQQEITDDITSVDASSWPQGTYVWKLTTNNEQNTVEEGKWVK